jgi:hypothetical protein
MENPQREDGIRPSGSTPGPQPPKVSVDLTTELRWFFDGALPTEVRSWFTGRGTCFVEKRRDTYRLDGQVDIGVKRRFGKILELKLRLRPPEPFTIGYELDGRLETWQRWSPADGRIYLSENTIWVDVDKTVIKREFDRDGREVPMADEIGPLTGEGCHVEIAALAVNGRPAWTFAFAAFGPPEGHRRSLENAWRDLVGEQPRPPRLRLRRETSCGYPEWMSTVCPLPARSRSRLE